MLIVEGIEQDKKTVEEYNTYWEVYRLLTGSTHPECVIYGEKSSTSGKPLIYKHPYEASFEELKLTTQQMAKRKAYPLAFYQEQIDGLKDYLEQGYMVKPIWEKIDEALKNGNLTSKDVEDLINEIYKLRQEGLKSEGEYSTGNLVFKELRNIGYLDELKDLKNQLKSKELSLE